MQTNISAGASRDEASPAFAAIFDIDGTMVDNAGFHEAAWIELSRRHGKLISAEFYRANIHARSNERNVPVLFGESCSPEFIGKISSEKEQIYRDMFRPAMEELPGLTGLLKALNDRSIPCAAASNSPKDNVDMVLDDLGIRKYFRAVVDRDQVDVGKPHPEIFLVAARKLGFPPDRCIVFEDSASGFAAADAANMPYVVITAGASPEDVKLAVNAKAMHRDFSTVAPDDLKGLSS